MSTPNRGPLYSRPRRPWSSDTILHRHNRTPITNEVNPVEEGSQRRRHTTRRRKTA